MLLYKFSLAVVFYSILGEHGNEKSALHTQWTTFGKKLKNLREQLHKPRATLAFAFIEVLLMCIMPLD